MEDITPNSDNGVRSSFTGKLTLAFLLASTLKNMMAHVIDRTLILGPAQWHCLLQRHIRIPGSSDLSILQYQHEIDGFDTELDIVACAAPFSDAPGFPSRKVTKSCCTALSGIASGIHYNLKEHY